MNTRFWIAAALSGLLLSHADAQDIRRVLPQTPSANPSLPALTTPVTPASLGGKQVVMPVLHGIVFVPSGDQIVPNGVPPFDGIRAKGLPFLEQPSFQEKISARLGKALTLDDINAITRQVVDQYVANDRPVVNAVIPQQNASSGVLQVLVIEGKVHQVKVEGNRWFNSSLLAEGVGLQPGNSISQQEMLENLNWLNQNPFRDVNAEFAAGPDVGTTDVTLRTQDRFPLRVYTGYDNTGNIQTGLDRWNAGFNYGDFLGQGQQLNYKFTGSGDFQSFLANSGSYVVPLPWHHTFTLFGGYIQTKTSTFDVFEGDGYSWQASGRYNIPLPLIGGYQQSMTAGYDFKQSNNNTEFGGVSVYSTATDVSQFMLGYDSSLADSLGNTSLSLNLFMSPGNMTSGNNTADFDVPEPGAHADYVYGQATVQRVTRLPADFSWIVRAIFQDSSTGLLGSEQLGLGGSDTVRGYLEREANGDEGAMVSTEIRSPTLSLASLFAPKSWKSVPKDQLQFLAFMDYGWTHNLHPSPDAAAEALTSEGGGETANAFLWSVGPGLRYTISDYLSLRFDYGFQLLDPHLGDPFSSIGELACTISY